MRLTLSFDEWDTWVNHLANLLAETRHGPGIHMDYSDAPGPVERHKATKFMRDFVETQKMEK